MPSEPDNKMEPLLGAYAARRRNAAGSPGTMPPHIRQALKSEVRQRLPQAPTADRRPPGGSRGWFAALAAMWPRIAVAGGLALALAGVIWWVNSGWLGSDRQPTRLASAPAGLGHPPAQPPAPAGPPPAVNSERFTRKRADVATADPTRELKQDLAEQPMADASAISAPKKPAPISAAAPPRSEPVQVQKVEAFADDKVAAPARVNQFNTPQLADAQPAPQPPAAPPAAPLTVPLPATPTPVPTPVPAPAVTLRRNQEEERLAAPLKVQIATTGGTEGAAPIATAGLAANSTAGRLFTLQTQSPSAPAQYFRNVYGGTSPPETDRRATPTRGVLPTPNPTLLKNQSQSQPQSQVSLTGAAQNKVKALNAPGVLANFMIEQSGPEVRFQDQDGSVYVGKLIAAGPDAAPSPRATSTANGGRTRFGRDAARNARAAAPTDQLAVDGFGSVANDTNAVAFEAVGTNATLQQNVRLVGRFYLGDANRTGFQFAGGTTAPAAPAQSLAESAPQLGAQRPALLVLSNAPARLILRVTGQAEFGGTNSIPIDAVPAQP